MMANRHTKGYNTVSDEVHGTNPICEHCEKAWPCDGSEQEAAFEATIAALRKHLIETLDAAEDMFAMPVGKEWFQSQVADFDRIAGFTAGECTCGYGGYHEPENPRCDLNQGR